MKIVVASTSAIKFKAVRHALKQIPPYFDFDVRTAKAPSGVNEQPLGLEETALGAENRLIVVERDHPDALIISIENGLDRQGQDLAIIHVRGPHTGSIIELSDRIQMPQSAIEAAKDRNLHTTTAGQVLAEQSGCQPDDPHAHLTGGKVTRLDLLVPPLVRALKRAVHHERNHRNTFRVEIRRTVIELPIRELKPGLSCAIYEPHRSIDFTRQAMKELAARLVMRGGEILLTPEGKGGGLIFALAEETNLPYEVARKGAKSYMLKPIVNSVREECMTDNGNAQNFCLDAESSQNLRGKRVILFDDVISTGGSIEALKRLCEQIGAEVLAVACVFTEGDRRPDVISLNHLPLYTS